MNIQPLNNNNISMQGKPKMNWDAIKKRIKQKTLDIVPTHTAKENKGSSDKWNKINNWVSKPVQNRGIMGVTALLTQPFIDGWNMKVDNETRKMAFINRIAIILSGTAVGMFVVRGPVYKVIEKMTDINGTSKNAKKLLPKKYLDEICKNEKYLKNYRSALAMTFILGINAITNVAFDAPLTIMLTNLMQKFCLKKESKNIPGKEVTQVKEAENG